MGSGATESAALPTRPGSGTTSADFPRDFGGRVSDDQELASGRDAVKDFYAARDRDNQYELQWGYVNPVAAAYWRMRDEVAFEQILRRFDPLASPLRILEIGSGHGHELAKLGQLGVAPEGLHGVELVSDRVARARLVYPQLTFSEQDATRLDYPSESFDIVFQYLCVMHADSVETQKAICAEMVRVLRPGGIVIWWDFAPMPWKTLLCQRLLESVLRPLDWRRHLAAVRDSGRELLSGAARRTALARTNGAYVRPVAPTELGRLFPDLQVDARMAGLDYEIWDAVWRRMRGLADAWWRRSRFPRHCFAVMDKPGDNPARRAPESGSNVR